MKQSAKFFLINIGLSERIANLFCISLSFMLLFGPFVWESALADQGNISQTDKYAWSETAGWVNFRPSHGGITVHDTYLAGYAWAANIGWIKLGNSNLGPYQNTTADNWGVNKDSEGNLSGYAWSEVWGWINFSPSHGHVTIGSDGRFDGHAWSQNLGWIHFRNPSPAYNVQKVNIAPSLIASNPDIPELTDDDTDNPGVFISEILAGSVSDVGNDALEGIALYTAASGNGQWQYSLDEGETWEPVGEIPETAALLLGAADKIRFIPNGIGMDEASFSFFAWDQTSGIRGDIADVSLRGDTSAFSMTADTASVTVVLIIHVAGQVTYYSSEEPMTEVFLILEREGESPYIISTDENGYFEFADIPSGDYTLTPLKSDDAGTDALTAEDASLIARYTVGAEAFSEYQKLAADVNQNDRVSPLDASDVARYSVGLSTSAGVSIAMNEEETHWTFDPPYFSYALDSDRDDQDFVGVRLGDVSGNYSALEPEPEPERGLERLSEAEIRVAAGERISVPVVLHDATDIRGIDLRIRFDADILAPADMTLSRGVLEYEDYQLVANMNDPGSISVAIFAESGNLFSGTGTILYLDVDVLTTRENAVIELVTFQCNESSVSDGYDRKRASGGVSGGFYVNDTVSRRLILIPGKEGDEEEGGTDDPMLRDLNRDGRIGVVDAVIAMRQGDLKTAIYALQCVVGLR